MKFKVILLSALLIIVLAGIGVGGYMLWPAIQGTITGNRYYTANEAQNLYDQGYADGSKSETELTAKVDYYKTLVDEYYVQVDTLTKQSTILQNENIRYSTQIQSLTEQKTSLENELSALKREAIQDKNKIIDLENEIDSLNAEITKLELNIFNNDNKIGEYEDSILKLQTSVKYYENYIANLETENQVVATFEFNGSVYNVQILSKGGKAIVTDPTSTESVVFNGWTVDGELVDLNTYIINTNTKFIADVSYKFTVEFSVDSTIVSTQLVAKDLTATSPAEAPTKSGYVFKGWSVDGTNIIDVSTYKISKDTKFVALFEKVYTATFQYENEVVNTQIVERGTCAENVVIEDTETKLFVGWTVNGELVDVNTYEITRDTIFIAKIDYKYLVTFTANNETFATELVLNGTSANTPDGTPTKAQQTFKGWSIDGINIIDVSTVAINNETTFVAVFGNIVVNDIVLESAEVVYSSGSFVPTSYENSIFVYTSNTLANIDLRSYSSIRLEFDYNYDFIEDKQDMVQGSGVGGGHAIIDITINYDPANNYARMAYPATTLFEYSTEESQVVTYSIASYDGSGSGSFFQLVSPNVSNSYINNIFAGQNKFQLNLSGLKEVNENKVIMADTLGYIYISDVSNVSIELIP